MTVNLKLLTGEPMRPEGYPLTFIIQHSGIKRKHQIGYCLPEHFIPGKDGGILNLHPEFETLYPEILNYKSKAKDILKQNPTDVDDVKKRVFGMAGGLDKFCVIGAEMVKSMEDAAKEFEVKKDHLNANKLYGNARVYDNLVNLLKVYSPDIYTHEITFSYLEALKKDRLLKGNSKSTVSLYLRTMRSLYNKIVKLHKLKDEKPFDGVFAGLRVKSHTVKKKNVSKSVVRQIEAIEHGYDSMYRWTDLWLLQFYLGGADLIDVYYLKHSQINKGRVYFTRGKLNTETVVDLALHPKAQAIIDKYKVVGEYIFPWRKDNDGYKTFRRTMATKLVKIQKRYGIELEGMGGNLGIKVARHTFGNIGKLEGVEEDLLRELMGHERDDVDNFYKDRFPQALRDAAHFKIIE